ncbi:uncharacterized protein LOC122257013 [Penaeus japonicus]|uniref:uncharacterized protein LOC122257013 n=1 Tax=Penaeus japonicus TaxID=27405 RepID=UPI001C717528|nr:uncharacterized protein LOC122257013 [Penaeus japonicus]
MAPPHATSLAVRSMVRIPGSGWDRSMSAVCCDFSKVSSLAASAVTPLPLPLLRQRVVPQPSAAPSNMDKLAPESQKKVCEEVAVGCRTGRKRTSQDSQLATGSSHAKVARVLSATSKAPSGAKRTATPTKVQITTSAKVEERTATKPNMQVVVIRTPQSGPNAPKQTAVKSVPTAQQGSLCRRPVQLIPLAQHHPVGVSSSSPPTAVGQTVLPLAANTPPRCEPVQLGVLPQTATAGLHQGIPITEASIQNLLEESKRLRRQNALLNQQVSHYLELFSNGQRLRREMSNLGIRVQVN